MISCAEQGTELMTAAVSGTRRSMKELVDGTIRVQIDIDPPQRADFLRLFPSIDMPVALAPLVPEASIEKPSPEAAENDVHQPNELARKLMANGYFRASRLWEAMEAAGIYTQAMHKVWIEAQPCLFANQHTENHGPCSGDVVLHHCSSAAIQAAGKGPNPRKPPSWYGVPLCAIGHHQNWAHASHGASRDDKKMLLELAVALTAGRMKVHAKEFMGIDSLREITPAILADFERGII